MCELSASNSRATCMQVAAHTPSIERLSIEELLLPAMCVCWSFFGDFPIKLMLITIQVLHQFIRDKAPLERLERCVSDTRKLQNGSTTGSTPFEPARMWSAMFVRQFFLSLVSFHLSFVSLLHLFTVAHFCSFVFDR